MTFSRTLVFLGVLLTVPMAAIAVEVDTLINKWADIRYRQADVDKEKKIQELKALAEEARRHATDQPDGADFHLWQGIITSTRASMIGGLAALNVAKEARDILEAALKKEHGEARAYGTAALGALYGKVPGWPIGFGSSKKAQALFEAALKLEPDNIDVNALYGEFLLDERRYKEAEAVLLHAKSLPTRPQYRVAEEGRKAEVERALARLEQAKTPQRVGPQP